MAAAPSALEFELNRQLFRTALNAFVRRHGPAAVDVAVRKMAFDTVSYTTRALNGAGAGYTHPKRIDTGRYRAAWNVAIEAAVGKKAGSTSVAARSRHTGEPNPAQADDGTATVSGSGLTRSITVENNVEYGPYIEFGTANMAPGLHLTRGLYVVGRDALKAVGVPLRAAWEGR